MFDYSRLFGFELMSLKFHVSYRVSKQILHSIGLPLGFQRLITFHVLYPCLHPHRLKQHFVVHKHTYKQAHTSDFN